MNIPVDAYYKVLSPRISVFVTSADTCGRVNAALHSFFTPVSINPPLLALATAREKDTLKNIQETGEFVINVPPVGLVHEVWVCAKRFPRGVTELESIGLTGVPSVKVLPPRIKECIIWLECKKLNEFEAGDHIMVIGEVVSAEVDKSILDETGYIKKPPTEVLMHAGGSVFTSPGKAINAEYSP